MPRGRLIKKAEQEKVGSINVEPYPWRDFSPQSILLTDNPRKSVVLAKSHPSQELDKKVQKPIEFARTFGHPAKPLFPQDMTAEFLASQEELRQRKRRMQMDEDEVVALELLDLDEEVEDSAAHQQQAHQQQQQSSDPRRQAETHFQAGLVQSPLNSRGGSPDISDLSALASHKGKGLDFTLNQVSRETLDAEVQAAFERGRSQGFEEGEKQGFSRALNEINQSNVNTEESATAVDFEAQAAQWAETAEQRYQEGLKAGMEQGRTEASQEAEAKYEHSMQLFTKALSELQHLKGELLSTGREIFSEIVQMCADKILRRHIQWNDEALSRVFTAAMSQFQAQDELKIEMHPEDIARLEKQIPENQRTRLRLIGNAKLDRGDIKIEANNEVVSFDIERTVESVIDSLKDELFDDARKEDPAEKAG